MKSRWLSDEEYNSIFSKVPRLSIDLIIENKDGILLTKRAIEPFKGMWHFPGGGVLFNELLRDSIKRIAKQELGVEVEIGKFLGTMEFIDEIKDKRHTVSIVFSAKIKSKEIKLDYQAEEFSFFKSTPESTIPEQKRFLDNYLSGH